MRLGYILLAHEKYETLKPQLETLTCNDDKVVLHYDASQPHIDDIVKIRQHFPSVVFAKSENVEWGEASIVRATLNAMRVFSEMDDSPEYITLLSGSCFPIKPRAELVQFLQDNRGVDFIECHDLKRKGPWVQDGLEWGRWELYHFLNWRKTPRLFSLSEKLQRKFRIKRAFPFGDTMYMGSQWWTLSIETIRATIDVIDKYDLIRFVNRTWIPDEFFFQTLVGNMAGSDKAIAKPLMKHRFNSAGIPKIYNHEDLSELIDTDKFFCRKIQHNDQGLIEQLNRCYTDAIPLAPTEYDVIDTAFQWYKRSGFKDWFQDCPLPITVIIDTSHAKDFMPSLRQSVRELDSSIKVYGKLFSSKEIDYNGEPGPTNYSPQDIRLRDYDWDEFMAQVALNSQRGLVFQSTSRKLNGLLDSLKSASNVLFIDLNDGIKSIADVERSNRLERYLSHHACRYMRASRSELSEIAQAVVDNSECNLYLSVTKDT